MRPVNLPPLDKECRQTLGTLLGIKDAELARTRAVLECRERQLGDEIEKRKLVDKRT